MDIKKVPNKSSSYWKLVRKRAFELGTDGCTGVVDIYVDCCYEHDIHWRTGRTLDGDPISAKEMNARFRWCIQSRSRFGRWSPMSWVRWMGVTVNAMLHPPTKAE